LFALVNIADLNHWSAGSLSVFQRSMRTSESERSTLIPVRSNRGHHQICTVDENPIMERNDEYSKRYVGRRKTNKESGQVAAKKKYYR